jgi:hypothetical protein
MKRWVLITALAFGAGGFRALVAMAAPAAIAADSARVESIKVEPAAVELAHADQTAQLIVTLKMSDGSERDGTGLVRFTSANPDIAKPVNGLMGLIKPRGDGTTQVSVSLADPARGSAGPATVAVTVRNFATPRKINFTNDIVPILGKLGCNAGGCHGKQSGQNGFKLSLLGAEPRADYAALVEESFGRRFMPTAPDHSLFLLKATATIVHGGGARLAVDSDSYRLIVRWIQQGMPWGEKTDPVVTGIEVQPRERIVPGAANTATQQLRIVARYSDDSTQDVTTATEYKSQQPDILKVDGNGLVTTLGRTGEATVMVRYMGMVDVARVTVPTLRRAPDEAYAAFKPKGYIDELVLAKWKKLGIAPSGTATDEQFIRRAYLDALGVLPTADEIQLFLNDPSPDKRDRLVDRVVDHPAYAAHWAYQWGDILRIKRRYSDQAKRGTYAMSAWMKNAFAQNMPYDQFVREILTAQGQPSDNPPVAWYREVRNNIHLVNDTSQLFLGTRVSCANCHHHPYERLSQDDYWGFAAFFSRVGKKESGGEDSVFVQKDGGVSNPRTGQGMKPKALNGPTYEYVRGEDPRQNLVAWMTAPDNPYFARAISNRMWAKFMGVGLVEAVDDMRITNPPSNPQLLDALAADVVAHKFDLKQLVRTLMKSQVYGLSSEPGPFNASDRQNYARYTARRLGSQVMADALDSATGVQQKYEGFPLGTTASELPDESVRSYLLDVFGRSQRESACECEHSEGPSVAQVLELMNSGDINSKVQSNDGVVAKLDKEKKPTDEIVRELFLRTFSRSPKPDELADAVAMIDKNKERRIALEDLLWGLLNSREFLFNH